MSAEDSPLITVQGAALDEAEAAAVMAVLGRIAAAAEQGEDDAGGTGPTDRTHERRDRMDQLGVGLWGRPGPNSWVSAAGMR